MRDAAKPSELSKARDALHVCSFSISQIKSRGQAQHASRPGICTALIVTVEDPTLTRLLCYPLLHNLVT